VEELRRTGAPFVEGMPEVKTATVAGR